MSKANDVLTLLEGRDVAGVTALLPGVLPLLRQTSRDSDAPAAARESALVVLGRVEPAATLETLVELLDDPNDWFRDRAIEFLGRFGSRAQVAVSRLISLLTHHDAYRRCKAAEALSGLGRAAQAAVPALLDALQDADEGVRLCAAMALGNSGMARSEVLEALRRRTSDRSPDVRAWARQALQRLGCEKQVGHHGRAGRSTTLAQAQPSRPARRRQRS